MCQVKRKSQLSLPNGLSPVRLVLPSQSDEQLLKILDDVGICLDSSLGSPSSLLDVIRANELAQADIAKAKEARVGVSASLVVAGGAVGEDDRCQVSPVQKHGAGKRAKPCKAPCRSSLRIKNLSFRQRPYFGTSEVSALGGAGINSKIWCDLKKSILLALFRPSNPLSPQVNFRLLLG